MNSELFCAAAQCVEADASAVVPAYHNTQHANTSPSRQDPTPRLSMLSQDDVLIKSPTMLSTILRRRNSAPAPATTATPSTIKREQELIAAFELFHTEQRPMSTQLSEHGPEVPTVTPISSNPSEQQPSKPEKDPIHCTICIAALPDEADFDFANKVIQACGQCGSSFCSSCIRRMFIEACTDLTRMPPRCCIPINISYARPHLTQDEIALFKAKYEERMTVRPFYCPVATCSVFIPDRLLPQRINTDGRRIDSGIGTPTSTTFACPTCQASICLDCRQLAHPCSACNVSEFGIDEETTRLLKRWGYRQCPKCRHGLKRMHGCNHMECRCGAHFCYICLEDPTRCGVDCRRHDDEYDEGDDDYYESLSGLDENQASVAPGEPAHTEAERKENETNNVLPVRYRNLDGGGSEYWEDQCLDFGNDPGDDIPDPHWNCHHNFTPHNIDLVQALTRDALQAAVECVKCWGTTYPTIRLAKVHRRAGKQVAGGCHGHTRGQEHYVPVRSDSYVDGTVQTRLRRNSTPACPISHNVPLFDASLVDAGHPSTELLRDLYGNVVFPAEPAHHQRRASMHENHMAASPRSQDVVSGPSFSSSSSLLTASAHSNPSPTISLTNECSWCKLLVCDSCKDNLVAAQKHEA